MADAVIGKRPYHAFLSHAHVDKGQADRLYDFLTRVAGFRVWYDAVDLPPGASFVRGLHEAIEESRNAIILLSHDSVASGWVRQEENAAERQNTDNDEFHVIPLLLDDVAPSGMLGNFTYTSIGKGELEPSAAAKILQALYLPPRIMPDPAHGKHTYLGRGWRAGDAAHAGAVAAALSGARLRLVGDAQDQEKSDTERVGGIMDGCGAFAAALPYRPSVPETTSTHVLGEWRLAAARGLPCLVIPHQDVSVPADARELPGLMPPTEDTGRLSEYAENLAEEWNTPRRAPYIFYATEFGKRELHRSVIAAVEAATGVSCLLGEYVTGSPVQREILRTVTGATMVLADITGDSPNVYIEAGAALSAGVPVALLRAGPPGRPVFMLRDQQVHDYATDAELVGRAVRVAYPYRRFLQT
jgi:TIR domain